MASILNASAGGVVVTASGSAAINIQAGGVDAIQVGTGQTVTVTNIALTNATATSANITTLTGASATISTILDANGNVRNIPSAGAAKTSLYTLSISDIGEFVTIGTSGAIDVPNGIFSAGNAVSLYNDTTGNVTVSLTITTAYIAGTNTDKASVTLATRGIATILFISNSVCVITGNVT